MKRLRICFICIVLSLTALLSYVSALTEDAPLIYVSGNPDSYPIEFYNVKSKCFEGLAPAILREFAEKYGYEIKYLDSGKADNRKSHCKNSQTDIISCCLQDGTVPEVAWRDGVTFFAGDTEYRFVFTSATGNTLKSQLAEYCASMTAEHSNALLLGAVSPIESKISRHNIAVGSALLLSFAAVVTLSVILKKRLDDEKKNKDRDVLTGVGNFLYLEKNYSKYINDKNRPLYIAVYFEAHLKDKRNDLNSLLKYMAVELNHEMGDTDILARIDNGFFCLKNSSEYLDAEEWTESVIAMLHDGINEDTAFSSGYVTGGIYFPGVHDRDLDIMISRTQQCSRFARYQEELCSVYSEQVETVIREKEDLKIDLRTAFQKDEFSVYLQFFVDSETKRILGAESLSRWNHPAKGILQPGSFIGILEEEGRIHELDYTVLRKSCECLERIENNSDSSFFITCNFSRNTILRSDYIETVKGIIESYSFQRDRLLIEVTEYAKIVDTEAFFRNINGVKSLGVKIVIDDFGCGFSDLTDIGKGNFDGVKLDKIFIEGKHTNADDIIIKALIDLIHSLNMTVIAEGIEKEEEAQRMLRLGCRVIQGYLYYVPMPLNEAIRVLSAQE